MRETKRISSVRELEVYQIAFDTAMEIFEVSKIFPKEEKYSLTDQVRRSSRSVCTNLAEGWRKRRYKAPYSSISCRMQSKRQQKPKHG